MKKHILTIFIVSVILPGCNPKLIQSSAPDIPEVGADRDEYGCIPSAGYQWSEMFEKCIRPWELPIRLQNARDPDASTVAYLIIDPIIEKSEVFLPDLGRGMLLSKTGALWQDAKKQYFLYKIEEGKYQLKNKKALLLYQTEL